MVSCACEFFLRTVADTQDRFFSHSSKAVYVNRLALAIMLPSICILQTLIVTAFAASCWRDTPCAGPSQTSFPGPWESNIFAPASRTLVPKSVLSLPLGNFVSHYQAGSDIALQTNDGQGVVFDFGLEVGGIITINYTLHVRRMVPKAGSRFLARKLNGLKGGSVPLLSGLTDRI